MHTDSAYTLDRRDVRGQMGARRASEIAAASGHHLLMIGPPGCGKSMLAMRLPALMPAGERGALPASRTAPRHEQRTRVPRSTPKSASLGKGKIPDEKGYASRGDGGEGCKPVLKVPKKWRVGIRREQAREAGTVGRQSKSPTDDG